MNVKRGLVHTSAGYIHYREAGAGSPIVLLHMNQQSSEVFLELMEALAPQACAIAVDYPSHGMSDHVLEQPTIGDYARWVLEVMDALGIPRATFLGESVGAVVCVELAVAHEARVDRIVMVNCPYYHDRGAADRSHGVLKGGARPSDPAGFPTTRTIEFMLEKDPGHSPMHPTQSWMDRINRAQIEAGRERWQALDALHKYDIPGSLVRVRKPVLQLTGEHFIYTKDLDEFRSRIPHVDSRILAGGRCCVGWEKADDIARATLQFIE